MSLVVLGVGGYFAYRRIVTLGTVAGSENARAFALHRDHGYVIADTERGGYSLWNVELATGEQTLLYAGEGVGQAMAADDGWVVWSLSDDSGSSHQGRTLAVPEAGGPARVLNDGGPAQSIAIGGGRAYLLINSEVLVVDLANDRETSHCCPPPSFYSVPVADVGADHEYGYFLTATYLNLQRHGSGRGEQLADKLPNATRMAIAPHGVYVVCRGSGADDGEIRYVPFDGTPPAVLVTGLRDIERPVLWDGWLAFIHSVPLEPGSSTSLMTLSLLPLAGGNMRTYKTRFSGELVSDGSRLYATQSSHVLKLTPP